MHDKEGQAWRSAARADHLLGQGAGVRCLVSGLGFVMGMEPTRDHAWSNQQAPSCPGIVKVSRSNFPLLPGPGCHSGGGGTVWLFPSAGICPGTFFPLPTTKLGTWNQE